jgi:hypothetical protein
MKIIQMDKTLAEYADQAYETARLGRNGVQTDRELVSAEMLAELEATGEAMSLDSRWSNCVEGNATAAQPSGGPSARCGG